MFEWRDVKATHVSHCDQRLLIHSIFSFSVHPEDKNGVNFPDDESVAVSVQTQ